MLRPAQCIAMHHLCFAAAQQEVSVETNTEYYVIVWLESSVCQVESSLFMESYGVTQRALQKTEHTKKDHNRATLDIFLVFR